MREGVTREQRNIDRLTAITPAVDFFEQRKERWQAFSLKLSRYFSFKAVPGLNRIPLRSFKGEWYRKVGYSCHQDDSLNAAPLIESRLIFGLFSTKFLSFLPTRILVSRSCLSDDPVRRPITPSSYNFR